MLDLKCNNDEVTIQPQEPYLEIPSDDLRDAEKFSLPTSFCPLQNMKSNPPLFHPPQFQKLKLHVGSFEDISKTSCFLKSLIIRQCLIDKTKKKKKIIQNYLGIWKIVLFSLSNSVNQKPK